VSAAPSLAAGLRALSERERLADACSIGLSVTIPMLVDSMDEQASLAYGAYPGRLYLIGVDGRIAFREDNDEVDGWEAAIEDLLADRS